MEVFVSLGEPVEGLEVGLVSVNGLQSSLDCLLRQLFLDHTVGNVRVECGQSGRSQHLFFF